MLTVLSLKEVPVEVDLAIEAAGYNPNYSKYQIDPSDLGDVVETYEGHLVMGTVENKDFYVKAIHHIAKYGQKRLDEIESSEIDE